MDILLFKCRMCARIALALALLAVASSTATADCLSEYGAGCTNCVNVTLTGGRRLMQSGPTVAAQHARGGGPGGRGGPGGGGRPGRGSRSALTCTACGTPGYVLLTETRGAVTLGRCGECSATCCATSSRQATEEAWESSCKSCSGMQFNGTAGVQPAMHGALDHVTSTPSSACSS